SARRPIDRRTIRRSSVLGRARSCSMTKRASVAVDRAQSFKAALEKGDRALGWTIARVPFDPAKVWKTMARLRVRGEVNGFAFRTSLFPDAGTGVRPGGFYLLIN